MSELLEWEINFLREMEMARASRQQGNEGRARVCARRAAGVVINEYFRRRGIANPQLSALNALRQLASYRAAPESVRDIAAHFLMHITPEHKLPDDIDLLAEAQWLADRLLRERHKDASAGQEA